VMTLAYLMLPVTTMAFVLAPGSPVLLSPARTTRPAPLIMTAKDDSELDAQWAQRLRRSISVGVAVLGCSIAMRAPCEALPLPELPAVVRETQAGTSALASAPGLAAMRQVVLSQHRSPSKGSRTRRDSMSNARADSAVKAGEERDVNIPRVQDVPRPWRAGARHEGGRITDSARLLDSESVTAIMQTIRQAESETGTEIMMVTLPSIGGTSPKRFATELFNEWHIGREEPNNGVLVLVVKDARRIEVEVGDGVVDKFSRSWTEQMLEDKVLPSFKTGRYSTGLIRCVDACASRLSADLGQEHLMQGLGYLLYGMLAMVGGGGRGSGGSDSGGSGYSGGGGGGGGSW